MGDVRTSRAAGRRVCDAAVSRGAVGFGSELDIVPRNSLVRIYTEPQDATWMESDGQRCQMFALGHYQSYRRAPLSTRCDVGLDTSFCDTKRARVISNDPNYQYPTAGIRGFAIWPWGCL